MTFEHPPKESVAVGRSGGRLLGAVAVAAALTPLNSTMIAVALPAMSESFGAQAATVTVLVVTGYLIATLVCQMPAGALADRMGQARALAAGRWTFAAGAALAVLAPTLGVVVVGRLLMAAGGAILVPTAMALIRVAVRSERRPRAFGAMGALMGGAAALGPAIGGLMIGRLGWRALFLINLPLLLASWLLQPSAIAAMDRSSRVTKRFDWVGSFLLAGALVLIVGATRSSAPAALWLAAGAAVACTGFLAWEARVPAPVLDLGLFRQSGFVAGAGVIASQNLAMYALLFLAPFRFAGGAASQSRLGLSVMAMTATMALSSPGGGWLAEKIGVRPCVLAGAVLGAAGIVWLTALPTSAPAQRISLCLLLVGLALGLSTGPAQAAALSAVHRDRSAMAAAVLAVLRYLGAIAGTAILGFALDGHGSDVLTRQSLALWAFAGAFLLSGLAAVGLPGRETNVALPSTSAAPEPDRSPS